jgi:hypothetical protein
MKTFSLAVLAALAVPLLAAPVTEGNIVARE